MIFLNQIISKNKLPSKVFLNSTTNGKYYYFNLTIINLNTINYYEVFGNKDTLELALKIDEIIYHKYLNNDKIFKTHLEAKHPINT